MKIELRGEMDTRHFLYPLMRALVHQGRTLVLTNNPFVSRLVEDPIELTFKDYVIIYTPGSAEEAMSNLGVVESSFQFIIFDNVPTVEYDSRIYVVTDTSTIDFVFNVSEDLLNEGVHLVKFGKKIDSPKPSRVKEERAKPERHVKKEKVRHERELRGPSAKKKSGGLFGKKNKQQDVEPSGDVAASRLSAVKSTPTPESMPVQTKAVETPMASAKGMQSYVPGVKFTENGKSKKTKSVQYFKLMTSEAIEEFEGRHVFPKLDRTVCDGIFTILSANLGMEKRIYDKEMMRNENSNYIGYASVGL